MTRRSLPGWGGPPQSGLTWFACAGLAAQLVGCGPAVPTIAEARDLGGETISAETLSRGQQVYRANCMACHGEHGGGDGPAGRALASPPRDFRAGSFVHKSTPGDALPTHADLRAVIRRGVVERGMPAWAGMSDADVDAVAHYVKTFSPRWAGSAPSTAPAASP